MRIQDTEMASGGASTPVQVRGHFDVSVIGLTAGSLQLEYKLSSSEEYPEPVWADFTDGTVTGTMSADGFYSFFCAHAITVRVQGTLNNSNMNVRIASSLEI